MFLHLSVILFTRGVGVCLPLGPGGVSAFGPTRGGAGVPASGSGEGVNLLDTHTPLNTPVGHWSGRYRFYWDAFLLLSFVVYCEMNTHLVSASFSVGYNWLYVCFRRVFYWSLSLISSERRTQLSRASSTSTTRSSWPCVCWTNPKPQCARRLKPQSKSEGVHANQT